MENENVKVLRTKNSSRSVDKNTKSPPTSVDEDVSLATPGDAGDQLSPDDDQEDGGEAVPTEEELRELRYKDIDDTEISYEVETSKLYRRAISDFDENETEVQLSEHWVFTDAELERDGHF